MEKDEKKWLEAIVTVIFDLEEGQLVDKVIPENYLTKKEKRAISYNSFPDSFSFNNEGKMLYTFHMRRSKKKNKKAQKEHINEKEEEEHCEVFQCFTSFLQRKDPKNPRGYFQKSFVFITKLKNYYSFFKKLSADLSAHYFDQEDEGILNEIYNMINNEWPVPLSAQNLSLSIFDFTYSVTSPKSNKKIAFSEKCLEMIELKRGDSQKSEGDGKEEEEEEERTEDMSEGGESKELNMEEALSLTPQSQGEFQDINIYGLLVGKRVLLWYKLWEIMMLNESLLVVADSPSVCRSEVIYGLLSIIKPFETSCEFYPYLTVFDKNVDSLSMELDKTEDGIIMGVTNPLFLKSFDHIENILRLDDDFEKDIIKKNLILKSVRTNTFLKSEKKKKMINDDSLKKLFTVNSTKESMMINNSILRKKLSNLSYSVVQVIRKFFKRQRNDLKIYKREEFLSFIKNRDKTPVMKLFGGKSSFVKFMSEFVHTKNFKNYIEKNFNIYSVKKLN